MPSEQEVYEDALCLVKRHDEWTFASDELSRPGYICGEIHLARELVRLHAVVRALRAENEQLRTAFKADRLEIIKNRAQLLQDDTAADNAARDEPPAFEGPVSEFEAFLEAPEKL